MRRIHVLAPQGRAARSRRCAVSTALMAQFELLLDGTLARFAAVRFRRVDRSARSQPVKYVPTLPADAAAVESLLLREAPEQR